MEEFIKNDYDDESQFNLLGAHGETEKSTTTNKIYNWFQRNDRLVRLVLGFICFLFVVITCCYIMHLVHQSLILVSEAREFINKNKSSTTQTFGHINLTLVQMQNLMNEVCCSFEYKCCNGGYQ